MDEAKCPVKVFIVDDSALVRERLMTLLADVDGIEVIGQAQEAQEAIDSIHQLKPDVVLLDICLTGGNGLDVLRCIKECLPTTVVMILTNYSYPQYREKCAEAGAEFFFDKSSEFDKINGVLRQLVQDFRCER